MQRPSSGVVLWQQRQQLAYRCIDAGVRRKGGGGRRGSDEGGGGGRGSGRGGGSSEVRSLKERLQSQGYISVRW